MTLTTTILLVINMLRLTCDYTLGGAKLAFVTDIEIESSWKNLTDTAMIKLPKRIADNEKVQPELKAGNSVVIGLGYDFENQQRFTGYMTIIGGKIPCEIKCEDEMWKLKQNTLTKSWKDLELDALIKFLRSSIGGTWDYEIFGDNVELGQFKIEKASGAKVLNDLKSKYGLHSFFRNGKLIVGKPYDPDPANRHEVKFNFNKNIISNSLEFKKKDEVKIKVTATNHKPDGKKTEVKVGDEDGEERTLQFYNVPDKTLKASAEALIDQLKYDGYRGKFVAFGEPFVAHGDVAVLEDTVYPDRGGSYFVDSVKTTFGMGGYRQEIELGFKAN